MHSVPIISFLEIDNYICLLYNSIQLVPYSLYGILDNIIGG